MLTGGGGADDQMPEMVPGASAAAAGWGDVPKGDDPAPAPPLPPPRALDPGGEGAPQGEAAERPPPLPTELPGAGPPQIGAATCCDGRRGTISSSGLSADEPKTLSGDGERWLPRVALEADGIEGSSSRTSSPPCWSTLGRPIGPGRWIARKSELIDEGPENELGPVGSEPTDGPATESAFCDGCRLWLAIDIGPDE